MSGGGIPRGWQPDPQLLAHIQPQDSTERRFPDWQADPQATLAAAEHIVHQLQVGRTQTISLNHLDVGNGPAKLVAVVDQVINRLTLTLRAHVLAEQLPPTVIREQVTGEVEAEQHGTWWDHFKATYRGRWWMRWRRWAVRYRIVLVPYSRTVIVHVRDHWTYPQAPPVALPDWGDPVMVSTWERVT